MAAYLIVHRREITDPDGLKAYADGVDDTIASFGGEVVARSDDFEVLEGDWAPGAHHVDSRPGRITVLRFPEMDSLKRWYESEEYAELKKIRQSSSQSDIAAVSSADGG